MKDINDAIKSGSTPKDLILGNVSSERGVIVLQDLQKKLETSQPKKKPGMIEEVFLEEQDSLALAWIEEELACHTILFEIRGCRGQGKLADLISKQLKKLAKTKKILLPTKVQQHTENTDAKVLEKIAALQRGGNRAKAEIILRHDPRWTDRLRLSEMDQAVYWTNDKNKLVKMVDHEERHVAMSLEKDYGVEMKEDLVGKMIDYAARFDINGKKKPEYHPVREYLRALKWDKVPRLKHFVGNDKKKSYIYCTETLALDATKRDYSELGYEDDEIPYITSLFGIIMFLSGAARAKRPGCKQDLLWTMIGEEGKFKSSLVKVIGVRKEWVSDTPINLTSKDGYQGLIGKWWIEMAEAHSLHKVGHTKLKSFVSSATDNYRRTYGRHAQDYPRTASMIATTNEEKLEFLNDHAGHRRHCVFKVESIKINRIIKDIHQLWAEAYHYIENGTAHWLTKYEEEMRYQHVDQYRMPDVWEQAMIRWLRKTPKKSISISDALAHLRIPSQYQTITQSRRIQAIFHTLGCKPGVKEKRGRKWIRTWTNPHFKVTDIPDDVLDECF